MLSRMAFFIQKRNYTLKQIMEFSLGSSGTKGAAKHSLSFGEKIPKSTPKAIEHKCCLFTCPQINGVTLHYKPSVPPSSSVCVFRPPKI